MPAHPFVLGHVAGVVIAGASGGSALPALRGSAGDLDLATGTEGLKFGYGEGEVLAGYDAEELDSEAKLDKYFSKKELVMSLEGGKLFVIVGGYQLKLPTNCNALIKYARLKGQTSARKRLPDHWRFSAPKLQDGKWIHDKDFGAPHTSCPSKRRNGGSARIAHSSPYR